MKPAGAAFPPHISSRHDAEVEQVPCDAVDEAVRRGTSRSGRTPCPTSSRPAPCRTAWHISTVPTRCRPRPQEPVLAHDDGVTRHDAALEQAEQRRHHEQRGQPVEGQEQQQRGRRPASTRLRAQLAARRTRRCGRQISRDEPAGDAGGHHQRRCSICGAARAGRGQAEVGAVGDDDATCGIDIATQQPRRPRTGAPAPGSSATGPEGRSDGRAAVAHRRGVDAGHRRRRLQRPADASASSGITGRR